MKKYLPFFFVVLFAFSCNSPEKQIDLETEITEIENALEKYIMANEKEDFALIESIWAPQADIVLYGTDSDERLVGWENIREAIKRQFALIENTYISASEQIINVSECGNTAWFAERLNYNFIYKGTAHSYDNIRFTGVMEKIDGRWVIVQAHLSLPASSKVIK
ncbi:MAG TPA: nuclear transport factor 2 family protein [Bacteroidales bacterium]